MELLKHPSLPLFGNLSPAELARYEKQLAAPYWGLSAQEKIKNARIFIAGGSGPVIAAAGNLVAAGVGHLRIVEPDRVSLQDLSDQLMYRERDLKKPKVQVLQQRLQEANPFSDIEGLERNITKNNICKITQGSDLLLGDLNNLPFALALNWAALKSQTPLILVWIRENRGYLTTLLPGRGMCLECTRLSEPPDVSRGYLAPLSGIVGGLLALEVLRLLGGLGPALFERVFGYDGESSRCLEESLGRKSACPVCTYTSPRPRSR